MIEKVKRWRSLWFEKLF